MVIKLYKQIADRIHYWEGFEWDGKALFRTAEVGMNSSIERLSPEAGESPDEVITRKAAEMEENEFNRIATDDHWQLYIQYRIDGFGNVEDIEYRHRVAEIVDDELGLRGAGAVDGGDIGSGSMNIFAFALEPNIVVPCIVRRLGEAGLLEGATIAVSPPNSTELYRVIWPEDFKGNFSVL